MLLYKLKALECLLKEKDHESPRIETVTKLQQLLLQIDYRVEVLPTFELDPLLSILETTQGAPLTEEEIALLKEILWEIG